MAFGRAALGFRGASPGAILGGRMPTAALRAAMARSASGALRDQLPESWSLAPVPTRWQPSADARCASLHGRTLPRKRSRSPRAPSLHLPQAEMGALGVWRGLGSDDSSPARRCLELQRTWRGNFLHLQESDGAQGEGCVPTVGVWSCSGRPRPDAKRRPRATWARSARSHAWAQPGLARRSQSAGRIGNPLGVSNSTSDGRDSILPPLQPSARRSRAPLSPM